MESPAPAEIDVMIIVNIDIKTNASIDPNFQTGFK